MMNSSGKVNVAHYGNGSNYIIGTHPAFNKKQKAFTTLKRQGDVDYAEVRETATFDQGKSHSQSD
jgi:hypothetical protein